MQEKEGSKYRIGFYRAANNMQPYNILVNEAGAFIDMKNTGGVMPVKTEQGPDGPTKGKKAGGKQWLQRIFYSATNI